jgi:3',5'-cyclic AMP phosphodiesterase CpdA
VILRSQLAAIAALLLLCAGPSWAFRVVVISDLNGSYGSTDYNPRVDQAEIAIIAMRPDLVISTGDMVAGQQRPHLSEVEVRAMWAAFHATVSDPLARAGIPFVVTPGNHDASAYGGFEHERELYDEAWRDRKPALDWVDGRDFPFFYAFDAGRHRFVSLDATTLGALGPEQMERLSGVLESSTGPAIVFSHLPLWPFAQGRETEIIGDPELADLFAAGGVALALSGHHHAYYPGARDGIAYVGQACLSGGPRRLLGETDLSPHGFTVLDIDPEGKVDVSARIGPGFEAVLPVDSLPARLGQGIGALTRLDLARVPGVMTGSSR